MLLRRLHFSFAQVGPFRRSAFLVAAAGVLAAHCGSRSDLAATWEDSAGDSRGTGGASHGGGPAGGSSSGEGGNGVAAGAGFGGANVVGTGGVPINGNGGNGHPT